MSATLGYTSEIRLFAFGFAPVGWAPCNGQRLPINQNQFLFSLFGNKYGGDERTYFNLPDLRGKIVLGSSFNHQLAETGGEAVHKLTVAEMPSHSHAVTASANNADAATPLNKFWAADLNYRDDAGAILSAKATSTTGNDEPHDNMAPFIAMHYCICLSGELPPHTLQEFTGTIIPLSIDIINHDLFANCIPCSGALLPVTAYGDLFTIIGTTYGGDGINNFRLPDLQNKSVVSCGAGDELTPYRLGETGGREFVGLSEDELPAHSHQPLASTNGSELKPSPGLTWAEPGLRPAPNVFASEKGKGAALNPAALGDQGGSAMHNNMMPYLVFNYYIVARGIKPPRP